MSNEEIGIAIVGAGWAGKMSANAYSKVPNVKVKVIVDVIEEAAKSLAEVYMCEWSTHYDEALEKDDVHVVDICSIPSTHATLALKAAEARKHICVQKPFALNLEDCKNVIDAANRNNVQLIMQHMFRFAEGTVKSNELIKNDRIGEPEVTFYQQVTTPRVIGKPWLTSPEKSGEQLIEFNVHGYDLLRWFHGEVNTVYAETALLHPLFMKTKLKADNSVVVLKFRNGSLGIVEGSWGLGENTLAPQSIVQTIGTKGMIDIVYEARPRTEYTWRLFQPDKPIETQRSSSHGWIERATYFIECVREGKTVSRSTGLDGLKSLEIGLAAVKSAGEHTPISLPL